MKRTSTSGSTLIRWEFARGRERLSCRVDRESETDGGAFAVAVLPQPQLQCTTIETFQAVAAALRRHAMLAASLRATGWKLVAYTM